MSWGAGELGCVGQKRNSAGAQSSGVSPLVSHTKRSAFHNGSTSLTNMRLRFEKLEFEFYIFPYLEV